MSGLDRYILDENGDPVPEPDLMKWARWFEASWPDARRVALTQVSDEVTVSTVFLGSDHNWFDAGPPILFETMVFGGVWDQHQWRHCTRVQALAAHDQIATHVRLYPDAQLELDLS